MEHYFVIALQVDVGQLFDNRYLLFLKPDLLSLKYEPAYNERDEGGDEGALVRVLLRNELQVALDEDGDVHGREQEGVAPDDEHVRAVDEDFEVVAIIDLIGVGLIVMNYVLDRLVVRALVLADVVPENRYRRQHVEYVRYVEAPKFPSLDLYQRKPDHYGNYGAHEEEDVCYDEVVGLRLVYLLLALQVVV